MTRLLLCASLLLFAGSARAQKLELGISGGYSYTTPLESPSSQTVVYAPAATRLPAYAIKTSYTRNRWQYGLSLEHKRTTYYDPPNYGCVMWYFTNPEDYKKEHMLLEEGQSAFFPIRLFVNRQVVFNRVIIYGGPSASYILFKNYYGKYFTSERFGLSAGLQLGASYAISKRIAINGEVSGDRIWFKRDNYIFKLYNMTAMTGLTYRLK
jgi:hypothetical protein